MLRKVIANFLAPRNYGTQFFLNGWIQQFNSIPFENKTEPEIGFIKKLHIQRVLEAIAKNKLMSSFKFWLLVRKLNFYFFKFGNFYYSLGVI